MGHDLGREARGNGQPAVDDRLTARPDLPHRVLPHVTLLSDGEMPRRDTALSNAPPRAAVKNPRGGLTGRRRWTSWGERRPRPAKKRPHAAPGGAHDPSSIPRRGEERAVILC